MSEQTMSTEELHAYIDGELPESRRQEIDAVLAQDSSLAAQVAAFRADKEALRRLYGSLGTGPLPRKWIDAIERRTSPRRRRAWIAASAALAASLVLLIIGSNVNHGALQGSVVNEALSARDNIVPPTEVVVWKASARLTNANAILERTLAMRARVPDLSDQGYALSRIQVYRSASNEGSVELIYRGPNDRDFTLYVRRSPGKPRFDVFEQEGVRVCVWQDDVISTVMAGHMSAAEMQRLASLAYNGLSA